MWDDFSDFELAQLVGSYGQADMIVFNESLQLANRGELEQFLTKLEFDIAFGE
jgi:hypothetical protein